MRTTALLPAAGTGQRLGQGPKALLTLNGRSLLGFVLDTLDRVVDDVILAAPPDYMEQFSAAFPDRTLVEGDQSRQATVFALLQAARTPFVLVHDAARPFLPRGVAQDVLAAGLRHGAATASLDVVDTLISRADGSAVTREELVAIQTPQAFSRELLLRAHEHAREYELEATDDAALVRLLGLDVKLVRGSRWLFKVTHEDDLDLARRLAPGWQEQQDAD